VCLYYLFLVIVPIVVLVRTLMMMMAWYMWLIAILCMIYCVCNVCIHDVKVYYCAHAFCHAHHTTSCTHARLPHRHCLDDICYMHLFTYSYMMMMYRWCILDYSPLLLCIAPSLSCYMSSSHFPHCDCTALPHTDYTQPQPTYYRYCCLLLYDMLLLCILPSLLFPRHVDFTHDALFCGCITLLCL